MASLKDKLFNLQGEQFKQLGELINQDYDSSMVNGSWLSELRLASTNESEVYKRVCIAAKSWKTGDYSIGWLNSRFDALTKFAIKLYIKQFCSKNETIQSFCTIDDQKALKYALFYHYSQVHNVFSENY